MVRRIDDDDRTISIIDLDVTTHEDFVVGFCTTSINESPQTARAKRTRVSRVLDKNPDEEFEHGAHFFIKKEPVEDRLKFYLEKVPGLGVANIQQLIRKIIKNLHIEAKNGCASSYEKSEHGFMSAPHRRQIKKRTGGLRMVGYMPLVHLKGEPVDDIADIINNGVLKKVKLTSGNAANQIAGRQYLTEGVHQLEVKIDKSLFSGEDLFSDVKQALLTRSSDFSTAQINYRDEEDTPGKVTLDLMTGNVLEENLTKRISIAPISPPLERSSDSIVPHFSQLVLDKLRMI